MSHPKPAIANIHQFPLDIPRPRRLRPHQHIPAAWMPLLAPLFRNRNRETHADTRAPIASGRYTFNFRFSVRREIPNCAAARC